MNGRVGLWLFSFLRLRRRWPEGPDEGNACDVFGEGPLTLPSLQAGEGKEEWLHDFQLICFTLRCDRVGAAGRGHGEEPGARGAQPGALTFFTTACVWLLADAEFLAIARAGLCRRGHGAVPVRRHDDLELLREGFIRALPFVIVAVSALAQTLALIGVRSMTSSRRGSAAAPACRTWNGSPPPHPASSCCPSRSPR